VARVLERTARRAQAPDTDAGVDMRIRREPEDDLLHEADDDPNFNESRYYSFSDRPTGLGGWVRLGNRPNEGYAEMTVCLYLPDGRVGFIFERPHIEGHHAHDAGGLHFEVVEPYQEHRVTYDGTVCVLTDPREMADPKSAFANNPHEPCVIELHLTAAADPSGGEPEWDEGEEPPPGTHQFARGHTEQHMASTGVVRVGDEEFELTEAFGLRDHSWGPRIWQSISWYRWIHANFGSLGIGCTLRGEPDSSVRHVSGHVYDVARYGDTRLVPVRSMELTSEYDDEWFVTRNKVLVTTDDHEYELHGDVWSSIPLRNRRAGQVTRLTEGMTRWTCGDLTGAGLSEYLDQVVDDLPVGIAAGA
jgi:hypothetical protein